MAKAVTTKNYFQKLTLIYSAQVIMLIVVGVVAFVLVESGQMGTPDNGLALLFQKVIIIAVPIAMIAAYFVFRFQMKQVEPSNPLPDKMKKYFAGIMIRSALLEVPGLLLAVAAMVTAQSLLLIVIPVIILVFILLRPTPSAACEDLNLSNDERSKLQNPDAVIAESEF